MDPSDDGCSHLTEVLRHWRQARSRVSDFDPGETEEQIPAEAYQGDEDPARRAPAAPDLILRSQPSPVSGTVPGLPGPALAAAAILLTPRSRGQVTLRSADPADAPAVDPRYLSDPHDREVLTDAFAWLRDRLSRQTPLASHLGAPLGPPIGTDEQTLRAHVEAHADSAWHLVGGCRMGSGADAVVEPDLAVHGITGLHVADASAIPTTPRGNVQPAVIMIAERGAQSIDRRLQLETRTG